MVLALAYEEELRLANISIYVSDEAGEPGRPTSVLTRRIKQAVGEWYVLELVEESRRGMEENTRQGFNTGGIAPYGYRKRFLPHPARSMADRGKHKVVLEPDSEQALVVERIFREFVSGEGGIRGIANDLNLDGVPSARGGPWTGAAVSGILDNPKYSGFQVWNRRRRKTGGNLTNPQAEWVWSKTPAHPAIIPLELWKAAQGMRRRPDTDWRRRPKSGLPARPLRGMVFCHCSRRMAAVQRARRTKAAVWYWECPSCKGRIRDDRLQTEVVGVLERELLRSDRLTALERHQEALLRGRRKEALRTRTRLEARLVSVKSDQHAQLRSVAAGIDPVLVKEVVDDLQREEREIQDQLRDTERPSDAVRALAAIRGLREHAGDLRTVLRHGDPEDQRKIFRRTIRSVTWLPEEERLELRLVLPEAQDEPAEGRRVDSVRARGGTRTHTPFRAGAFKAPPSAIPAPGRRRL